MLFRSELIHDKLRAFGMAKPEEADALMATAGSMIVGSEGILVGSDHSTAITCLPKDKFAKIETNRPLGIPQSRGIYADWIDACRGGKPHILASFENGGRLSELLMLGNIATQYPGETLAYDPITGTITSHADANPKLTFNYRDGWRI